MKLAEGLLRRKELQEKVNQLRQVQISDVFEIKISQRIKITDTIDEISMQVPKLTASQVTKEYDFYATRLRKIDAAIQRTNWDTDLDVSSSVDENFIIKED